MVALVHPSLSGVGPWLCLQPLCLARDPARAVSSTPGLHLGADKSQMRFPESGPTCLLCITLRTLCAACRSCTPQTDLSVFSPGGAISPRLPVCGKPHSTWTVKLDTLKSFFLHQAVESYSSTFSSCASSYLLPLILSAWRGNSHCFPHV